MGNIFYFDWEVDLIEWIQNTMGSVGEAISKVVTFLGGETCLLIILLVMLFCYKKESGKRCGFTILAASMWFPMIKNIALRMRPYMAHPERINALSIVEPDADPMDIVQQGYSCPSGHAATAASLFGSAAYEIRKRWMWFVAVIMPLLIGFSRIAVGVHYPTDVLAGWAIGVLAVGFNVLLQKKVKKEWMRFAIVLAIAIPGLFWCRSRDYFSALGMLIGAAFAFPYEAKYVQFKDTRNPWAMILRVIGAFAIYYALNTLLKLPFSKEFLDNGTLGAGLVRTARYAVVLFVALGIYPKVFPVFEKIGKKQ